MQREDDNDIQYKVKLGTWKKIITIVFRSKKRIFLLVGFSLMIGILDAVFPLINRYAIDVYFIGGDYSTWPYFIAANILSLK